VFFLDDQGFKVVGPDHFPGGIGNAVIGDEDIDITQITNFDKAGLVKL
jgi:hypothetical protein